MSSGAGAGSVRGLLSLPRAAQSLAVRSCDHLSWDTSGCWTREKVQYGKRFCRDEGANAALVTFHRERNPSSDSVLQEQGKLHQLRNWQNKQEERDLEILRKDVKPLFKDFLNTVIVGSLGCFLFCSWYCGRC